MITAEHINLLAVVVVWILYVGIGSFWYSPAGFGKLWSKLSGVDIMKTPKEETNRAIIYVIISSFLQALFLAIILSSLNVQTIGQGLLTAFVLWFGFTALTTVGNTLYQRLSWKFWWLNASFFLVVMLIGGIILSVWK